MFFWYKSYLHVYLQGFLTAAKAALSLLVTGFFTSPPPAQPPGRAALIWKLGRPGPLAPLRYLDLDGRSDPTPDEILIEIYHIQ